jgi:hypothetical protein
MSKLTVPSAAKLTVAELMEKLELKDRPEVMKGIMAWVEEGVLDEVEDEADTYEVLEYAKAEEDMRARPSTQGSRMLCVISQIALNVSEQVNLLRNPLQSKRHSSNKPSRCGCTGRSAS